LSQNTIAAGSAGPAASRRDDSGTTFAILVSLSICHLLNDMNQSLVPAIYPILKDAYHLDFAQIGLITLAFQFTASMLQPVVGMVTDKYPQPFSLPVAMTCSLIGLMMLSMVDSYELILVSAALIGIGSSVFHPESSRVARMASGGRYGLAQSLFQVGGSTGSAIGPLLAAFVVGVRGQSSIAWFSVAALIAIAVLSYVSIWYNRHPAMEARRNRRGPAVAQTQGPLPQRTVILALGVVLILLFSKNLYTSSLSSYYTFYLIQKFQVSVQDSQLLLFLFLGSVAVGTFAGGPIGDRFGRKPVIWFSILGALPFTLVLPYAGLWGTAVLTVLIGLIMASAFSAILVYAQELMPGRVGMVAGMMFGFSFGLGGLGAAALGEVADRTSIETVYVACSFLPLIGLLTAFLPHVEERR